MRLALNFERVEPNRGGAETYVADLARRLVRDGHEVHLYANSWGEHTLPAGLVPHQVTISGLTRRGRIRSFAENSARALSAAFFDCTVGFINTWHHDVIIPQGGVQAASLECNARRFPPGIRRRLYLWAKHANPKWSLHEAIERKQYDLRRASRVVAVSQMVKGHLERFHGVPPERIRVVPNAIDAGRLALEDPTAVRRRFRAEYGLTKSDLVGLFVGHNFRLKGLPPLLDALALRRQRDPAARPIHLLVCGGGPLAVARHWVNRAGLADVVQLIGFASSIADCYHASDFFVLPTYYDPCSLVVFEALACGLPVITTAFNGAGELISRGCEGFVISAPDAHDELIAALDRMTRDSDRRMMAAHATRLGQAQSFDRHVGRLVALFEEVADSKRPRVPRTRPPVHAGEARWTKDKGQRTDQEKKSLA
jgi:UDP-glucose:(heptosyl)LPS alpha-1,3-glucosyltransferase